MKNLTSKKYTCKIGDIVVCRNKLVVVVEVQKPGSELNKRRAHVKCLRTNKDLSPVIGSVVYAGDEWSHRNVPEF